MASIPKKILSFGSFQLIVPDRVLTQDGKPVSIKPRSVEVLAVLAVHANEVVSKDDLMRIVWPDTFVEEGNLAVHVSALRKLLAGADSNLEIETIPRCGYRLVGEIRTFVPESRAPAPADEIVRTPSAGLPEGAVRRPLYPLRHWTLGGIALAMLLLILLGVGLERWGNRVQGDVEAGGARIHSLAVLPLQNLSGDPAQDYFAAGITDELTTEVAHIHGLRVVSRTSASQFQAGSRSLPDIARALGVEGVMEGSVVRAGNRVRITAQLIEAKNDRHIWAGSFEGSVDEIIALQDRVARDVAREIRAAVKPEGALLPASARGSAAGVNQKAYDDYLLGLYIWNRRDERTFDKAIEYFSRSSAEDPHFAPAFASLADVYVLCGLNSFPGSKFGPLARQASLQALALDADSAEAHTALGAVSAVFDWDWGTAGREFQRAVDLDPNYATAHQWYADFYLIPQLRLDKAASEMEAAATLDPLSPIMLVDQGWVDYLRGEYPQARQKYDRALAIDPDFIPAVFRMEGWYLAQGRDAEYAQTIARAFRATETTTSEIKARAVEDGFARDGIRGVARAQVQSNGHPVAPGSDLGAFSAWQYAMLGDSVRACNSLRGSLIRREPALLYVNVDPMYSVLRACPCYSEVARQIGLPQLPVSSVGSHSAKQ